MTMRLTVFYEFAKPEVLEKVPKNVTVEKATEAWKTSEEKRTDLEKELLATNAKLLFDPKTVDQEEVERVLVELQELGFTIVERGPMTSTNYKMDDRVILKME
eukprot:TRINITY_DN3412_c0_g1_i2.p1 TRINITY_DN3412_c0_g1~~TRINITY_DN3412_c0_g1_i2.p1  ORF type:complete len:119 (+),score=32.66 TRINITY_DN3412_c0_g1_i2:49-357(+)